MFLGAYVEKVQATDLDVGTNAQISYSLASTSYSDRFNINPDSGLVTTRLVVSTFIGLSCIEVFVLLILR